MRIYCLVFYFFFITLVMGFFFTPSAFANCEYKKILSMKQDKTLLAPISYTKTFTKHKGILKLVSNKPFTTLSPFGIGTMPADYYMLGYDTLFSVSLNDINTFFPLLATSYCQSNNKLIIKINLQAKWNDGVAVNANDVLFTFYSLKKIAYPTYFQTLKQIKSFKLLNSHTLVLFSELPFSKKQLASLFSIPIMPKHYWQHHDLLTNSLLIPPFSGGYTIKKLTPDGKLIIWQQNPNYWGKNLPIRQGYYNFLVMQYTYANSMQDTLKLWQQHQVNFIKQLNPVDIPPEKLGQKTIIKYFPIGYIPPFKGFFFNTTKTNLQKVQVRHAIALAYNFASINKYIFNNQQQRLHSLFSNSDFAELNFQPEFNLVKADQFLNTAGFIVKKGKRITNNGEELFILSIVFNSKQEVNNNLVFLHNLQLLGITVHVKVVDLSKYPLLLKNKDYDLLLGTYLFSDNPSTELQQYFSLSDPNIYNYSQLHDVFVNKTIQQIIQKPDNNRALLQKLDAYLQKQYIYIPLFYYPKQVYIYKDIFKPYKVTPFGIDIFTLEAK
ncbi:extracellular solute-binding protein [Candidatus Hepatincola sp. Av]